MFNMFSETMCVRMGFHLMKKRRNKKKRLRSFFFLSFFLIFHRPFNNITLSRCACVVSERVPLIKYVYRAQKCFCSALLQFVDIHIHFDYFVQFLLIFSCIFSLLNMCMCLTMFYSLYLTQTHKEVHWNIVTSYIYNMPIISNYDLFFCFECKTSMNETGLHSFDKYIYSKELFCGEFG